MNGEQVTSPTREEIAELVEATMRFIHKISSSHRIAFMDDREWFPIFGRVADALRPLRSFPPRLDGWPQRTGRAIRGIASAFDGITLDWGWEAVAEPEPSRSAHVKVCLDRFVETIERPMYEAALSWQAGADQLPISEFVDGIADDGFKQHYRPTMSPEQGKACWDDLRAKWITTPCLGKCAPEVAECWRVAICENYNLLDSALKDADADALRRKAKESVSPGPTEDASPHSPALATEDQNAPKPVPADAPVNAIATSGYTTERKPAKKPTRVQFNTYKLWMLQGKQKQASKVSGISQSQISKRCKVVREWLAEGNALPSEYA